MTQPNVKQPGIAQDLAALRVLLATSWMGTEAHAAGVRWSLIGACVKATGDEGPRSSALVAHLHVSLDPGGGIVMWDTAPGRTLADVLALVDASIRREHGPTEHGNGLPAK
jgi:hypothetical protein